MTTKDLPSLFGFFDESFEFDFAYDGLIYHAAANISDMRVNGTSYSACVMARPINADSSDARPYDCFIFGQFINGKCYLDNIEIAIINDALEYINIKPIFTNIDGELVNTGCRDCSVLVYDDVSPDDKLKQAIRLVKSAASVHPYAIAFSGGKDSCLLRYIAKEANINAPLYYCSTTIDPPGTIAFCQRMGANILRPQYSFLQLVERKGLPSMFRRYCCEFLKEQYISDYLMLGVRRAESIKRSQRYCTFEAVRQYSKSKITLQLLPIVFFSDYDVEYIINDKQIECHPLYYDSNGSFCVSRRLGCIGCPLASDRGVSDYKQYPILLRQVIKRLIKYHQSKGRTKDFAYLDIVRQLFYSNHGEYKFQQTFNGLFSTDPKAFVEQQFNISLP